MKPTQSKAGRWCSTKVVGAGSQCTLHFTDPINFLICLNKLSSVFLSLARKTLINKETLWSLHKNECWSNIFSTRKISALICMLKTHVLIQKRIRFGIGAYSLLVFEVLLSKGRQILSIFLGYYRVLLKLAFWHGTHCNWTSSPPNQWCQGYHCPILLDLRNFTGAPGLSV